MPKLVVVSTLPNASSLATTRGYVAASVELTDAVPIFAPYPAATMYLPSADNDKSPSVAAVPDNVKAHEAPTVKGFMVMVDFPGVGLPSNSRNSRNTGVAEPVSAPLPSPTRNATNDNGPPPPPLELEEEDAEDAEEDAEDDDDDDDDDEEPLDDELDEALDDELEEEFAPEDDDELAPPVPSPPAPLLEEELLDAGPPQSPPSPPPPPLPMVVRFEPSAHATKKNGVRTNAEKANLVVEHDRRSNTAEPF